MNCSKCTHLKHEGICGYLEMVSSVPVVLMPCECRESK